MTYICYRYQIIKIQIKCNNRYKLLVTIKNIIIAWLNKQFNFGKILAYFIYLVR